MDLPTKNALIQYIFLLDSSSAPALLPGGALRPAVEAALAHGIMYFEERKQHFEAMPVLQRMLQAFESVGYKDPEKQILDMAKVIREDFNANNLHLTTREVSYSNPNPNPNPNTNSNNPNVYL
jgi:hypothetical protein